MSVDMNCERVETVVPMFDCRQMEWLMVSEAKKEKNIERFGVSGQSEVINGIKQNCFCTVVSLKPRSECFVFLLKWRYSLS